MPEIMFAMTAESRRAWLRLWNSRIERRSWQKTLTTFSPEMVSSMKPFTLPRFFCCAPKYLAEAPPMRPAARSMTATIARVTPVRGIESMSIEIRTITIVETELMN